MFNKQFRENSLKKIAMFHECWLLLLVDGGSVDKPNKTKSRKLLVSELVQSVILPRQSFIKHS